MVVHICHDEKCNQTHHSHDTYEYVGANAHTDFLQNPYSPLVCLKGMRG